MTAMIWVLFAIAAIMVVVSLIMSPDSDAFSGALVGSSDLDLFKVSKERGSKKALKWTMMGFGIAIMIGSLIARAIV